MQKELKLLCNQKTKQAKSSRKLESYILFSKYKLPVWQISDTLENFVINETGYTVICVEQMV